MIDGKKEKYLRSIPNLAGVAGALVSNENNQIFTSNRGENTVGIFDHGKDHDLKKIRVGGRPNGLAFDKSRSTLLAANVPRPDSNDPVTVSIVDINRGVMTADVIVPGRTRWSVFDRKTERFYVNISNPSQIAIFDAKDPDGISGSIRIPATGAHGLDVDLDGRRLFCACDEGQLCEISLESEKVTRQSKLAGAPDVIFYNPELEHLYVTIGNPAVLQVFDTRTMREIQIIPTELGTHTIAFNQDSGKIYAFMPETHRASIYKET